MGYKLKRFFNKWFPIALIAAVVYGGYNYVYKGRCRRNNPVVKTLSQIPIVGSYFKPKYKRYSYRSYRRGKHYGYSKRKHHRRHRRGRRH